MQPTRAGRAAGEPSVVTAVRLAAAAHNERCQAQAR